MKKRWPAKQIALYCLLLAGCLVMALLTDFTIFGTRIDNYAYDVLYRLFPPQDWEPKSAVLAIDDPTFQMYKGVGRMRVILADALNTLAQVEPKSVAVDVILADQVDEAEDGPLERAMAASRNLILPLEVINGVWEQPIERFRRHARAVGHVHPEESTADGVCRRIPMAIIARGDKLPRERHWALAVEAFGPQTLDDQSAGDMLRIRFRPSGIPTASLHDIKNDPKLLEMFRGRTVFVGITSLSARRDQVASPLGGQLSGVLLHAHAFETLSNGRLLPEARPSTVLAMCVLIVVATGLIFALLSGWPAYTAAGLLLAFAHGVPLLFFRNDVVFPFFAAFASAWLSVAAAASFQHFVVRRQLRHAESDRERYQQAIHMVAHEMRSPLTAIQGSSEMMGRYNLTEDKRKQIAGMINSESKRLARMIQTFLDVERLSAGQMELKREPFTASEVVATCVERANPLAERKKIAIHLNEPVGGRLLGDRELLEYALYNLLTNAVKYSPADTEVQVSSVAQNGHVRVSVKDQGIGMDEQERKNLFRKFYRTEKAEKSGEVGTGIGLSLVKEIVTQHGGTMEVASSPGKGSCFVMVLPAHEPRPE